MTGCELPLKPVEKVLNGPEKVPKSTNFFTPLLWYALRGDRPRSVKNGVRNNLHIDRRGAVQTEHVQTALRVAYCWIGAYCIPVGTACIALGEAGRFAGG